MHVTMYVCMATHTYELHRFNPLGFYQHCEGGLHTRLQLKVPRNKLESWNVGPFEDLPRTLPS